MKTLEVMLGNGDARVITCGPQLDPMSKLMILNPLAALALIIASRSEPLPESFVLVTV